VGLGAGNLPEEARVRTYQADIRQDGSALTVTLNGATFIGWSVVAGRHTGACGRVVPGAVEFDVPSPDGDELPWLGERLAVSRSLVLAGSVVATGSVNRLSGALDGQF
jgi:hypothetical protein